MRWLRKTYNLVLYFLKLKKKPTGAETIGHMFNIEHHEGGYYTLPVIIESETHGYTKPTELKLTKDI